MISVVIPVYNGEDSILDVYNEIEKTLSQNFKDYEIVFVDDGSLDRTPSLLKEISEKDKKVKVISLSKNSGQHIALIEGFKNTKGDIIVSDDCDLECLPHNIPRFIEEVKSGYDIVCGVREERKTSLFRKASSFIFNRILSILTGIKLKDIGCPMKAYTKSVAEEIVKYGDIPSSVFFWKKFKIKEINIESRDIFHKSSYNLFKLLKLAIYVIKKYVILSTKYSRVKVQFLLI